MEASFDIATFALTTFAVFGLGGLGLIALPWTDGEIADSGLAFRVLGSTIIALVLTPLGRGERVQAVVA